MSVFNPIAASKNIRDEFIDYITTTFSFADRAYQRQFEAALRREDAVAKGPFLDIGGSYETGHTLRQLMESGDADRGFEVLERAPEAQKELKLDRPLYLHQESALRRANSGRSLIVTTGTGSGKTECFLIPVINHLLREMAAGELDDAVRAIVIYPMNALANDQMKRMRALLKDCESIRFGLYNGNTKHRRSDALDDYRSAHRNAEPLPNEVLSREEMQERPPHILITNYSMMEYMLLRPRDGGVFRNARLKFIVLDEAHIYRGTTGMETALLLRRMRARISHRERLQYILTSATLGGPEDDEQILEFAKRLCGVDFTRDCIIRARLKQHEIQTRRDVPPRLFVELSGANGNVSEILHRYGLDAVEGADDGERLYDLCLNSRIYEALRLAAANPVTIPDLVARVGQLVPVTEEELVAFIEVCARAGRDGAKLIRPRYHFFVRALEGAYITIGDRKELYLNRRNGATLDVGERAAFEAAVCTDCGRVALAGRNSDGKLIQTANRAGDDSGEYYLIKDPEDDAWFLDEDDGDEDAAIDDYVVCSVCGAIRSDNGGARYPCEHGAGAYVRVLKVAGGKDGACRCPACGNGRLRKFYLGSEAATAVLGMDLFEQLPDVEIEAPAARAAAPASRGLFGVRRERAVRREKTRQFLCFSDSRSEAAYFASYMERMYGEFLRRRGVWHVAEKFRREGRHEVSMRDFVRELTVYFESNKSFMEWDATGSAYGVSKENAWVAMLNEMYSARRASGLISMGVFSVRYRGKDEDATRAPVDYFIEEFGLSEREARALHELLILDGVYTGAIDAGGEELLSEAQREYIFFSPTPQKLVKLKNANEAARTSEHGWSARKRTNGNYFPNVRVSRLCNALGVDPEMANRILDTYWDAVFQPETETFAFDANDFDVLLYDHRDMPFYRCRKCGRVTPHNVRGRCASVKCSGELEPFDALQAAQGNHYANLYRSEQMKPLFIKEHTAQLSKVQQSRYQEAFVNRQINALSCSTTFEMGVDVGSLETVYMRNVPPSPSNYVQRAGRAGRGRNAAAFVLTYAKLSSHDFTYYAHPENMISGNISAPLFELENEKIIRRHIFAVALSYFFHCDPAAYDGDNRAAFLLEGGYERLRELLNPVPDELAELLRKSIPEQMHGRMGISDGSWVESMIGEGEEPGILEQVYRSFHGEIEDLKKLCERYHRNHEPEQENQASYQLRMTRAGRDDNAGRRSLIDFLVRNNILPKYGFPVDTVELYPFGRERVDREENQLRLNRDLQMAIADYAPGAETVADGQLYRSRYILKGLGRTAGSDWEKGAFSTCDCGQRNFTKEFIPRGEGRECVSCRRKIPYRRWFPTIEPRRGFQAEKAEPVPTHRPERGIRLEDDYIGDPNRNLIDRREYEINGRRVALESTANDSLVVVSGESYSVCPRCGYATDGVIKEGHRNGRGFVCAGKASEAKEYRLSHDFKTDVAKITFLDASASNKERMLSVMYALLEGLSRAMDIERSDIKGCLHYTATERGLIYSVVLYDAVAGGAGNVRRMVTEDGAAFQRVIATAIRLLRDCKCDTSCYSCLRNYYNQKIHDLLDRHKALDFLEGWVGAPRRIAEAEGARQN